MTEEQEQRFRLPTRVRDKAEQIAQLSCDLLEDVLQAVLVAVRGAGQKTVATERPAPRRRSPTYRPTGPISETDRKAAERLLTKRGFVRMKD